MRIRMRMYSVGKWCIRVSYMNIFIRS
jgi:hypothetical protein